MITFNWNVFPSTRLEKAQMLAPLGCLYPLAVGGTPVEGLPTKCSCGAYINNQIKIDRHNQLWVCPICGQRNLLPYEIGDVASDARADIASPVVEYAVPDDIAQTAGDRRRAVLFVVDTYQHHDDEGEFALLVETLQLAIDSLDDGVFVMVMSYDEDVRVHRPGSTIAFRPKDIADDTVAQRLGIVQKIAIEASELPLVINNYLIELAPLSRPNVTTLLASLTKKTTATYRPPRATGPALQLAAKLLSSASYRGLVGDIIAFVSGPGTIAPGNVSDGKSIRTHSDIVNLQARHFIDAVAFYRKLGASAAAATAPAHHPRFSFHVFSGSVDQVGLAEMRPMVEASCGLLSLHDRFSGSHFRRALAALVSEKSTRHATLTVLTSRGLKVHSIIGLGTPLASLYLDSEKLWLQHDEKINDSFSEYDAPAVRTNRRFFCQVKGELVAVYFDVDTKLALSQLKLNDIQEVFIQFNLRYYNNGWKERTTTIRKPTTLASLVAHMSRMTDGLVRLLTSKTKIIKERDLLASFDASTWATLLARILLDKMDSQHGYDGALEVAKHIDTAFMGLLRHFGGLNTLALLTPYDRPEYRINESFRSLPPLLYHLRRNPQLVDVFNSLPDETAYHHLWFLRADGPTSVSMMRPDLYEWHDGFVKTSLDAMGPAPFVVLDLVFHVVVYYTQPTLQLHPSENDDIVETLDAFGFLQQLSRHRRPVPRYVVTQKGHSQARFLLARLSTSAQPKKKPTGLAGFFARLSVSYESTMAQVGCLDDYYTALIELMD